MTEKQKRKMFREYLKAPWFGHGTFKENAKLYEVAKKLNHEFGFPWTDPRTGITYQPPESKKLQALKEKHFTPKGRKARIRKSLKALKGRLDK
jgi:hypothetical protein